VAFQERLFYFLVKVILEQTSSHHPANPGRVHPVGHRRHHHEARLEERGCDDAGLAAAGDRYACPVRLHLWIPAQVHPAQPGQEDVGHHCHHRHLQFHPRAQGLTFRAQVNLLLRFVPPDSPLFLESNFFALAFVTQAFIQSHHWKIISIVLCPDHGISALQGKGDDP